MTEEWTYCERLTPAQSNLLHKLYKHDGELQLVCEELNISKSTAKTHISAILQALGATDRAQMIIKAIKKGFLDISQCQDTTKEGIK